jgi:hypothetical protein
MQGKLFDLLLSLFAMSSEHFPKQKIRRGGIAGDSSNSDRGPSRAGMGTLYVEDQQTMWSGSPRQEILQKAYPFVFSNPPDLFLFLCLNPMQEVSPRTTSRVVFCITVLHV